MRSRCADRTDTKSASLTGSVRDANISLRRADIEYPDARADTGDLAHRSCNFPFYPYCVTYQLP